MGCKNYVQRYDEKNYLFATGNGCNFAILYIFLYYHYCNLNKMEKKKLYFRLIIFFIADPTTRGTAKFGDKCNTDTDCGFPGSDCYNGYCSCAPQYKSTNHVDKCGKRKYPIIFDCDTKFFILFHFALSELHRKFNFNCTNSFHNFIFKFLVLIIQKSEKYYKVSS